MPANVYNVDPKSTWMAIVITRIARKKKLWPNSSNTLKSCLPTFLQLIWLKIWRNTKIWKISVRRSNLNLAASCYATLLLGSFSQEASAPAIYFSLQIIVIIWKTITMIFHTEIPRICLQTEAESTAAFPLNGLPSMTESTGGSVDKAIAAKVSIIALIQRSWTALNGDSPIMIAPKRITNRTEILTVTWN